MLAVFKNNKVVAEKNKKVHRCICDYFRKLDGYTFCDKCKNQDNINLDSFDNFIKNNNTTAEI